MKKKNLELIKEVNHLSDDDYETYMKLCDVCSWEQLCDLGMRTIATAKYADDNGVSLQDAWSVTCAYCNKDKE